jgi:hypothetical protein
MTGRRPPRQATNKATRNSYIVGDLLDVAPRNNFRDAVAPEGLKLTVATHGAGRLWLRSKTLFPLRYQLNLGLLLF